MPREIVSVDYELCDNCDACIPQRANFQEDSWEGYCWVCYEMVFDRKKSNKYVPEIKYSQVNKVKMVLGNWNRIFNTNFDITLYEEVFKWYAAINLPEISTMPLYVQPAFNPLEKQQMLVIGYSKDVLGKYAPNEINKIILDYTIKIVGNYQAQKCRREILGTQLEELPTNKYYCFVDPREGQIRPSNYRRRFYTNFNFRYAMVQRGYNAWTWSDMKSLWMKIHDWEEKSSYTGYGRWIKKDKGQAKQGQEFPRYNERF